MRYGDILPAGFVVPSSAFWLKNDLTVEKNPFKDLPTPERATVMDCGAFIGTFTAACLEQRAWHVTCYEAAPKNAGILRMNMARYGTHVTLIEKALTATDAQIVTLNMSGFSGTNSILPPTTTKSKSIEVPALNFRRELLRVRPQVLKLDVEGAEYDLLESLEVGDLASVESLFIEFHPIEDREELIDDISQFLVHEGFTIINARRRTFTAVRKPEGFLEFE